MMDLSQPLGVTMTHDDEAALLLLGLFDPKESQPVISTGGAPRPDSERQSLSLPHGLDRINTSEASQATLSEDDPPRQSASYEPQPTGSRLNDIGRSTSPLLHPRKRKRTSAGNINHIRSQGMNRISHELQAEASLNNTSLALPSKARPDLEHFMGYDNQLYRCICGTTMEPDEGMSIQCESCLAWQHAGCFGLSGSDLEGDSYFCQLCDPDREHSVNEPYIIHIRQLAYTVETTAKAPESITSAATGDAAAMRDIKRAKLAGIPRGKGRARPGSASARPSDSPIDSVSTRTEESLVNAGPSRGVRKKSLMNVRLHKGRNLTLSSEYGEQVSRKNEPSIERSDSNYDQDFVSRQLDYVNITSNIARDEATWIVLEALRRDALTAAPLFGSNHKDGKITCSDEDIAIPATMRFGLLDAPIPPIHSRRGAKSLNDVTSTIAVKRLDEERSSQIAARTQDELLMKTQEKAKYAVYACADIHPGAYVGEYRGEVYSSMEYELNRANQYLSLGLPKAFVRRLGSPLDLVIDSRKYGCEMRFIRSSCHPNVVIRPMQSSEGPVNDSQSRLIFGVFTVEPVLRGSELTLGWEWDDQHIAHEISAIQTPCDVHTSNRMQEVIRNLTRALPGCACTDPRYCAWAQLSTMSTKAAGPNEPIAKNTYFGPLIGVTRQWRISSEDFKSAIEDSTEDAVHSDPVIYSLYPDDQDLTGCLETASPGAFKAASLACSRQASLTPPRTPISLPAPNMEESGSRFFPSPENVESEYDYGSDAISESSTLTEPLSPPIFDTADTSEDVILSYGSITEGQDSSALPSSLSLRTAEAASRRFMPQLSESTPSHLGLPSTTHVLDIRPLPAVDVERKEQLDLAEPTEGTQNALNASSDIVQLSKKRRIDLTRFMLDDSSPVHRPQRSEKKAPKPDVAAVTAQILHPVESPYTLDVAQDHLEDGTSDAPWWRSTINPPLVGAAGLSKASATGSVSGEHDGLTALQAGQSSD